MEHSNNMPQTTKVIDADLKSMCKRLIDKDAVNEIARECGFSSSYVYYVINGDRYNQELIDKLKSYCITKVDEFAKAIEEFKLKQVNPQEIDN